MKLEDIFIKQFDQEFPFEITNHQRELALRLAKFVLNPEEKSLFILQGYAGTGKTSLMGSLVKSLPSVRKKSVLLAPTGRAAKVLSQRAGKSAFTIHKKIYQKSSAANGAVKLSVAINLHTDTLFVIDEASMIGDYTMQNDGNISSRNLLDDLISYVYSGKRCKLIFIGDVGQLPPVGADFSPALNEEYLRNNFFGFKIEEFKLTEVLRQAVESDILYNATLLRSAPEDTYPSFQMRNKPDLMRIDGLDLQDAIESSYNDVGMDETVIITRSNKRANAFNQQVRGRILWYEEDLSAGDYLMVVKNNYYWLDDKSEAGFVANGEIIEVLRVQSREEMYGFNFVKAIVRLIDYPKMAEQEVTLLMDTLTEETPNLSREKLKELFFAVEEDYAHVKNKKQRYEQIMKDPYFNALQIKYAYAVTCHKSQGGQWSTVFLDQGYLTDEMLNKEYFRWLYTGFTRAVDKLYLVNFNDQFFNEDQST